MISLISLSWRALLPFWLTGMLFLLKLFNQSTIWSLRYPIFLLNYCLSYEPWTYDPNVCAVKRNTLMSRNTLLSQTLSTLALLLRGWGFNVRKKVLESRSFNDLHDKASCFCLNWALEIAREEGAFWAGIQDLIELVMGHVYHLAIARNIMNLLKVLDGKLCSEPHLVITHLWICFGDPSCNALVEFFFGFVGLRGPPTHISEH